MQNSGQLRSNLESYFDRYSDVPREVILKEDVLRLGVTFSEAALNASAGCRLKSYYLFTFDKVRATDMSRGESLRVPDEMCVSGGPYGLLRTVIRTVISDDSPYCVDVVDDKVVLRNGDDPIADVSYPRMPRYYSKQFGDGTGYGEVVPLLFDHVAFVTTYRICQFWGEKEECKFCDINENTRQLRQVRGVRAVPKAYKDPQQVAHVIEAMVNEEPNPEHRVFSIIMTSGTILKEVNGKAGTDFQAQYVEAIRERIGGRIPILLITEPKARDEAKRLRDCGVTSLNANIEVWDKNLWAVLCPGKHKYFGRDKWIQLTIENVDVFGEGNISPNFVAGVEMAQPYGFKDVTSAVKSTVDGFDFLMSHGVLPHLDNWCIEPGAALGGHPPIPLEYFIEVDRAWYELWKKYNLPPVCGFGPMGPGRGCYGNSGCIDMGT